MAPSSRIDSGQRPRFERVGHGIYQLAGSA